MRFLFNRHPVSRIRAPSLGSSFLDRAPFNASLYLHNISRGDTYRERARIRGRGSLVVVNVESAVSDWFERRKEKKKLIDVSSFFFVSGKVSF